MRDCTTMLEDHLNRQLRREADLAHADYSLLAHLSSHPDHLLSMSDLAERLKITRSRLTHAITRLEQQGLVERRNHPEDGRLHLAALTAHGLGVLQDAAPGHVRAVRSAVFDKLSRQQVTELERICRAIADGLDEDLPWERR